MKTRSSIFAALLLAVPLAPGLARADGEKPAETPKKEEPKKEEPKADKDQKPPKFEEQKSGDAPKGEEPKKDESEKKPAPGEKPKKFEEQKSEQAPKDETKEAPKGPSPQEKYSRETAEILKSWEPALEDVRRATVQ